jgi:ATP/maltotriose-dependent transcriptional regulator MalT
LLNALAGAELWTGQLALAETHTGEALVAAEALGQHRVTAGTYANRALIEMIYGRLHDASTAAKASLVAARRAGRTEDSLLARAHLVHAYVAFSHLHLDPAAEALERVERISERATDPLVSALAEHLAARLLAESGDLDAALAFQSGPTVPDELPAYLVWVFALVRAQWAVRVGDTHEARRLAQQMLTGGWPEGHGVLTAILTDLDGDPVSALHQLDRLMAESPRHAAMLTTAIAAVYKVRMLLRDGNPRLLRPALHDMLARVGPHRLYSALIFTGPDPALDRLLRQEAARARPQPYAAKAADALDRYRQYRSRAAGAAGVVGSGRGSEPTPLTTREADVLRELALGGEYADVAQALFVSENTVKTHIGRLYRKLGADRRADALRTARERGLL